MKPNLLNSIGLQSYEKAISSDLVHSLMFQVSMLCTAIIIASIILFVIKKEKYILHAIIAAVGIEALVLGIIETKRYMDAKTASAPAAAAQKTQPRFVEITVTGTDAEDAYEKMANKLFEVVFKTGEGKNFSDLGEKTRELMREKLAPYIDLNSEMGEDNSLKMKAKINLDETEKALVNLGYSFNALAVSFGIGANSTEYQDSELLKRLIWAVERQSDYFLGGAFYTVRENLEAELSVMEFNLGEGIKQAKFMRLDEDPSGQRKFRAVFEIH